MIVIGIHMPEDGPKTETLQMWINNVLRLIGHPKIIVKLEKSLEKNTLMQYNIFFFFLYITWILVAIYS